MHGHRTLLAVGIAILVAACGGASADSGDAQNTGPAAVAMQTAATGGSIDATLEGRATTWHIVTGTSQGRNYASGAWVSAGDGERLLSLGGFDTETPPLDSFGWTGNMPTSFGDYAGSAIQILFPARPDRVPYRISFPIEEVGLMASVIYMPKATFDPSGMWELSAGTLEVTQLTFEGGRASAEGTFSGTLERMGGGDRVTVGEGRFRATALPDATTLGR